ncbi:MAG: flagellar M-ring protein FliF, partial [Alphaproteobacteria bacterium]|nr:flagellar M-ring protein FliF [Alphaproteobacteria bacterium]
SVTVASNLPNGAGAAGGDSSSNNSETRERVNYEVSETRREVQRGPGAIKRLTVAVLVDGIRTLDPNTEETIWTPRSEEELAALSALVTSAIGLDETRGDQITIKTMEFEPLLVAGTEAQSSLISGINIDLMSIIQLAVLAVVSLVLGLFVLRPILSKPTVSALPAPPDSAERSGMDNMPATIPMPEMPRSNVPALNGEIDGGFELPTLGVVSDFDFGDEEFGISNDPVKRLKRLIEDRQDETVEILRGWMEDTEENA